MCGQCKRGHYLPALSLYAATRPELFNIDICFCCSTSLPHLYDGICISNYTFHCSYLAPPWKRVPKPAGLRVVVCPALRQTLQLLRRQMISSILFSQHGVLFVFASGKSRSPTMLGITDDNLSSVSFGLFLSLMDTTIVATALYTIGVDLKSLGSINWVALAYTLSYLGCAVIFSRIADIFGRRNAYIAAFLIFFAFSLGCGFSTSLTELIACRTLQGVGGSGLYSLTFVILPEISPPKMIQAIGAIAGVVVAMAGVLGPVLGGLITHYTTWKWIFWIKQVILLAIKC